MDYTIRFAHQVKAYIDRIPNVVWGDFERSFLPGRKWQENEILRSSILKDGFDQKDYLKEANNNPVYRLDVRCQDYGGAEEETLTGADLAIIFILKFDGKVVSQRLVFVQLKRAYFKDNKTEFDALHEKSGQKFFGKAIHQARKLLLCSNHSYYWFAMTSGILQDSVSLGTYLKDSNLRQIHQQSINPTTSYLNERTQDLFMTMLDQFETADMNGFTDHDWQAFIEEEAYYLRRYRVSLRPLLRKLSPSKVRLQYHQLLHQLPYIHLRNLRTRLHEVASVPVGMIDRIGLLVCHAESVLGFEQSRSKSFQSVYDASIPFSSFLLQHVLGDDFGESDQDLIAAVQSGDAKNYIKDKISQAAHLYGLASDTDALPEHMNIVNAAVTLTLNITSLPTAQDQDAPRVE